MRKEISRFEKGVRILTAGGLLLSACKTVEAKVSQPEIDEKLNEPVATETIPVPVSIENPLPTLPPSAPVPELFAKEEFSGNVKVVEQEGVILSGQLNESFWKAVENEGLDIERTQPVGFWLHNESGRNQLVLYGGLLYPEQEGQEVADLERMYFYAEWDGYKFVPAGSGGEGVLFPMGVTELPDGGISLGIGTVDSDQMYTQLIDNVLSVGSTGAVYTDPFSGIQVELSGDQVPGVLKVLARPAEAGALAVSESLKNELETEYWKVSQPVQHEDGTWVLYRQHSVTNKQELVRVYQEGEWKDYIKRLESPNGRVFWDIHASWYEYVGQPEEITMWQWNPDIPDASARWQEAAYRALWSLAAYGKDNGGQLLNPGITLDQITNGAQFHYLNNQGEVVTVDTSQPVRFVWDLNSKGWEGHKFGYAFIEKFWEDVDEKNSISFYPIGEVMLKDPSIMLADINYWFMLRGISIPELIKGRIDVGFRYDFYIKDNPDSTNYDQIETLLYGKVAKGKGEEGVPDDLDRNANPNKELLQVQRGEGFVSAFD
jgi:hypothetical protein